ncbi:hypothetical protein TNCV_2389231 [Trichonephila clavipes]|nr:hypothetical protein TNCV_2389231 [Trichonephila clavipes]
MFRSGGQSESRFPVFKSPSMLGTHLSTHCSRDERNHVTNNDVYFLHGNTSIERNKKHGCLLRLTSVRMGNYRECSDDSPGALPERSPVGHSEKVASRRKR